MSGISFHSSASNVVREESTILPALLIEQLAGTSFSSAEKCKIICAYYSACGSSAFVKQLDERALVGSEVSGSVNSRVSSMAGVELGACYLRAVKASYREQVFAKLGTEPSWLSLLQLPRRLFLSDGVLRQIRVKCGFEGLHHVSDHGEYDFLAAVRELAGQADRWQDYQLAGRVLISDKREKPGALASLALDHRVGMKALQHNGVVASLAELFRKQSTADGCVTLVDVLSLPVESFKPRGDVQNYGVNITSGGLQLVRAGGEERWLTVATHYANESYPLGSLGRALALGPAPYWGQSWNWPDVVPEFSSVSRSKRERLVGGLSIRSDGFCYLAAVRDELQALMAERLGSSPTFRSLLQSNSESFCDFQQLSALKVTKTSDALYHVGDSGRSLVDVLYCLRGRYFQSYEPGTFAAQVAKWPVSGTYYRCYDVGDTDRLGSGVGNVYEMGSSIQDGDQDYTSTYVTQDGMQYGQANALSGGGATCCLLCDCGVCDGCDECGDCGDCNC